MVQLRGVFAELERQLIRERTSEGQRRRVEAGGWPGGPPPYGYQSVPAPHLPGHVLVVHDDEAAVIRLACTMASVRPRHGQRFARATTSSSHSASNATTSDACEARTWRPRDWQVVFGPLCPRSNDPDRRRSHTPTEADRTTRPPGAGARLDTLLKMRRQGTGGDHLRRSPPGQHRAGVPGLPADPAHPRDPDHGTDPRVVLVALGEGAEVAELAHAAFGAVLAFEADVRTA